MTRRLVDPSVLGALVVALLLDPRGTALAQVGDDEVRAWLKSGDEAFVAERYDDAERWYERAFAARPGHDVAANLAETELRLKKRTEAAEHLRFALSKWPVTADPKEKDAFAQKLEALRGELVAVKIEAPTGAIVSVDDRSLGSSPVDGEVFLEPGEHRFGAKLDGRAATPVVKTYAAGTSDTVRFAIPDAAPNGNGEVGNGDASRTPVPGIVMVALGAVGLGVGIGLVVHAGSVGDEADELTASVVADGGRCGDALVPGFEARCEEIDDRVATSQRFTTGGWVGVGIGGAVAVAGVVYLLWPEDDGAPKQTLHVTPMLAPEVGGAVVSGTF
jgi:hypothetical protein